jgi:hypothetical protein
MQQIAIQLMQQKLRIYRQHNWTIVEAKMVKVRAIVLADVLRPLTVAIASRAESEAQFRSGSQSKNETVFVVSPVYRN